MVRPTHTSSRGAAAPIRIALAFLLAAPLAATALGAQSIGARGAATFSDVWHDPVGAGLFVDFRRSERVDLRLAFDWASGSGDVLSNCSPVIPDCPPAVSVPVRTRVTSASVALPVSVVQRTAASLHIVPGLRVTDDGATGVGADLGVELRLTPSWLGRFALVASADRTAMARLVQSDADASYRERAFSANRVTLGLRTRFTR